MTRWQEKFCNQSWGLWSQCPLDIETAWGARCYFDRGDLKLNTFTQSHYYSDQYEIEKLLGIINSRLEVIQRTCKERYLLSLDPTERLVNTILDTDDFVLKADTNASHGYLYLIAWLK